MSVTFTAILNDGAGNFVESLYPRYNTEYLTVEDNEAGDWLVLSEDWSMTWVNDGPYFWNHKVYVRMSNDNVCTAETLAYHRG